MNTKRQNQKRWKTKSHSLSQQEPNQPTKSTKDIDMQSPHSNDLCFFSLQDSPKIKQWTDSSSLFSPSTLGESPNQSRNDPSKIE